MTNKEILDTLVMCGRLSVKDLEGTPVFINSESSCKSKIRLYDIEYNLEKFVKILNKYDSEALLYMMNVIDTLYKMIRDKEKVKKCYDNLYNLIVIYDRYFEHNELVDMLLDVRLNTMIMNVKFDNFDRMDRVLRKKRKLDISTKKNKDNWKINVEVDIKYKNSLWELVRVEDSNHFINKSSLECVKDVGYIELFEDRLEIHKGCIYDINIREDSVCLV